MAHIVVKAYAPPMVSAERAASAKDTLDAINAACRAKGGHYAQYSCKTVSWDDVSRGTIGGGLSCWGANITDTYLKAKDSTRLFTVRPDNWNEKLGHVNADEVALVAGHTLPGTTELAPVTLRDFLRRMGEHGAYAGLPKDADLSSAALDEQVSIRFQTTFLPIAGGDARGTLEFAPEAYNYNTRSDEDPRNLVLLCTTQGVAMQQDGAGAKRLFHHAVDKAGVIHRYWLEAERSDHCVGGAQVETAAERADALERNKATASVIGTRAMGTRFNVLMTIQVPLAQQRQGVPLVVPLNVPDTRLVQREARRRARIRRARIRMAMSAATKSADDDNGACVSSGFVFCGAAPKALQEKKEDEDVDVGGLSGNINDDEVPTRSRATEESRTGVATAARVSRGAEHGIWTGLRVTNPKRHPHEHMTVTVVLYNTVAGGVPSPEDVAAAIDDLEKLYAACGAEARLAESKFDFMKAPLTAQDANDIATKVMTQPYAPQSLPVSNASAFPSSSSSAAL